MCNEAPACVITEHDVLKFSVWDPQPPRCNTISGQHISVPSATVVLNDPPAQGIRARQEGALDLYVTCVGFVHAHNDVHNVLDTA